MYVRCAVASLLLSGCGPRLDCGPGTVDRNGICRPTQQLECGPGTLRVGDVCEAEADTSTSAETTDPCGPGTTERNGLCVDLEDQYLSLPFPVGAVVHIGQGNHGWFSHAGWSNYAVDFPVPIGTPIAAARGGRVWNMKEDSDYGCETPDCGAFANFVHIDHGDGTFAKYLHLDFEGVEVEIGDDVYVGQTIGYSGNTGFSTGPHLHFQVDDALDQSLPLRFAELPENDGIPYSGIDFISETSPDLADIGHAWSSCPRTLFQFMGVILDSDVPCSVAEVDVAHPFTGTTLGENLMIGRFSNELADWVYYCVRPSADGSFEANLRWPDEDYGESSYLMIQAADADCYSYQGFASSPKIMLE